MKNVKQKLLNKKITNDIILNINNKKKKNDTKQNIKIIYVP